jgi:hypothetical protein
MLLLYMFAVILRDPWRLGLSEPTLGGFICVLLGVAIMLVWQRIIAPIKPIGASFR